MKDLLIFLAVFLFAYFGVGLFRSWSLRRELFDIPNERSSHDKPVPRGGGLVIVAVCLLFYSLGAVLFENPFSWSYFVGAILIAIVSWLDDLFSIPLIWRFLVHCAAAIILVGGTDFGHLINVPIFGYYVGWGGISIITFLWIVWMVNAYNFMDGIDGIAGLQGVLAGSGWLLFGLFHGYEGISFYGGVLIFGCLGFLFHNWHPAKVFMGDVGSAFLGFTFAAFPLLATGERVGNFEPLLIAAFSFVWFFLFDTALTLVLRLSRRKKVWMPHREHLYQRLIILGKSHDSVTVLYGLLAAVIVAVAVAYTVFRGIFGVLLFFIMVVLSLLLVFLSFRKKRIDLSN